jgi:hypothetical protein
VVPPAPEPELRLVRADTPDATRAPSELLEQWAVHPPSLPAGVKDDSKEDRLTQRPFDSMCDNSIVAPMDAPRRWWPAEVLLYPLSVVGLVHLVGLWLLLFWLCPFIMSLGLGTEYVPFVYTLPVAYALYYFAECIRDRAAGGRHPPDYWMHPSDSSKWDCLTQMFEMVGCIAVCFWPVSVYYVVREQVDWIYWLLLGVGGFFFPMVLLAVVLFDSLSALNPILIGGSILRTFVPYCGMVLLLCGEALLSARIGLPLNGFHPLPMGPWLLWLVQLYLVFITLALLGGFYQRHKDRLDWAV